MFNMIVVMYINYDVHQRDRSCQDLSGRSWIKTPDPCSETEQSVREGKRISQMFALDRERGWWDSWEERYAGWFSCPQQHQLVKHIITALRVTIRRSCRSHAPHYEWKLMRFACVSISPCRQVSFSETLESHFLPKEYWFILISALPGFYMRLSLRANLKIYSLDPVRENIAFSYSLHAVENYVQMTLSLTYSEGNKLLLRLKWNNLRV